MTEALRQDQARRRKQSRDVVRHLREAQRQLGADVTAEVDRARARLDRDIAAADADALLLDSDFDSLGEEWPPVPVIETD